MWDVLVKFLEKIGKIKKETSDTISPKRKIPLAGEGERDGVWG